ncbi:MAG: hypothetical protein HZA46_18855 [Planctomycetales bacterium]|nr:hypothetical protein [Planctomycetales bacterium]
MTIEKLHSVIQAQPFHPFTIQMADGREYFVPHRDFVWQTPPGRTVIVHSGDETDDSMEILDLLLMTGINVQKNGSSPKSGGSARKK